MIPKTSEANYFFNLVVNSISQGVWGLDFDGKVTFINKAAVKMLGYESAEELVGQPMHALVHHSHPDGSHYPREQCPMYDSFRNANHHHVVDEVLWRKDGSSFAVSYRSAPIMDGEKVVGAVVSFEDLSDQLKLQQQIEQERALAVHASKLASLGEMSAGVAHEINNPLAIISGLVDGLVSAAKEPAKLEAKIVSIKKSIARISKIVTGLRKFARSGDITIFDAVSIDKILRECIDLTEPKSKANFTPVKLESNVSAAIFCNDSEIEQVFINLINNSIDAVKNLEEKWVQLKAFDEAEQIVVQVIDSGLGISEEIEQKLFRAFFTTKPVGEGTGIGLSISKGILERHKATIAINRSMPNTCFEIRFAKYLPEQKSKVA